jgi:ATP-dependent exoDNAse (exonuclease V) beta subunit
MNTLEFINKESGKGKTVGTDIHKSIENYILTGQATVDTQYPDEVTNALKSFIMFKKENPKVVLQLSEMALTSEKYKYNGTIDCIGELDGEKIIVDWKSGNAKDKDQPDIYDEYKYQVAAYVHLYNELNPGGFISKALIVSIAKDKIANTTYLMRQDEIDGCFEEVFLPALKILNYQRRK